MTSVLAIPRGPEDVTPAWLGSVLGTDVDTVEVTPIGTGQTGATYRVSATYGGDTDLPASFAVKLSAQDDAVRERVALGYRSEVEFYSLIADRMRIPVPRSFHQDISDDGTDVVLLLADMAPAVQGDQIAGCNPTEARLAVEALAGLHGPSWCATEWMDLSAIVMPKPGDVEAAKGMGDVCKMAADIVIDRLGASISADDQQTLTAAMASVTPWLMAEPDRFALMHGDYRLDNMLFDPERTRITVVDWQTVGIGLPARDLAYFTATSLEPTVRAEIERDLIERYHRALLIYDVPDYDLETCWTDYRLGMVQAPLLVALGTAFATSTERGDEMMLAMLSRGCRAIRELETMELINSYR
ncbi:aminoglycoside phosphotransferase [Mycobacterium sp. GA-1285]|uniref:phosphotransferase family protein n=1 Tax=Mycobacterium sp. GA-1285 TaxID=1772282 RepID=UPI000747BA25|nr:aminoglycoside phosphotransferase family protein [Mycobacterium sp. GA-1285]KUI23252.1 aminoglycoside phosphotransferase [Mycobacterium sp. GA-1285]